MKYLILLTSPVLALGSAILGLLALLLVICFPRQIEALMDMAHRQFDARL